MSGIGSLGLACNVMQVISFAHETIVFCKAVYQGASPDVQLQDNAQSLAKLSDEISQQDQALVAQTASQTRLCEIARKCKEAATALQEEIGFLTDRHTQGNLIATLRIAAKSKWRKDRLDRLEKSVRDCQNTLDTHLLARIYNQHHAIEMQMSSEFTKLDKHMQHVVGSIASGQSKISEIVQATVLQIKSHSTEESKRTGRELATHVTNAVSQSQTAIEGHVTHMTNTIHIANENMSKLSLSCSNQGQREQQRQQFLQSFRFSGFNERKTHLAETHKDTFSWILPYSRRHQPDVEAFDEESCSNYGYNSLPRTSVDSARGNTVTSHTDAKPLDVTGESNYESHAPDSEDSDGESSASAYFLDFDAPIQDIRSWDKFADWLKSESRIYWIKGKPGSGKSTLVKYLVDSRQTKEALNVWSQGTVVVSHFFWGPGSLLQRNVKGALFCLIHQLLNRDPVILDTILAQYAPESSTTKSEPADWSEKELETTLFKVLELYSTRLCIFLDGLDEVCQQDGVVKLSHLVDNLRAMPYVKVCVASRPERAFKAKFGDFRQLRLQDLTQGDMIKYAQDSLESCWGDGRLSSPERRHILSRLICKAQGVFLWLQIALRNIQSGILNGDSYGELVQRLQDLPPELNELYWEMWNRLNKNTIVYREISARYLNIILEAKNVSRKSHPILDSDQPSVFDSELSLLQMMGATDAETQNTLLGKRVPSKSFNSTEHWHKAWEIIKTKCAGIIDLSQIWTDDDIPKIFRYRQEVLRSLPVMLSRLVFIHRTAYDFLTGTEHGEYILSFDKSSPGSRRLQFIKGVLAELRLVSEGRGTELMLQQVILALSEIKESELDEEVQDTLRICWICFEEIRARRRQSLQIRPSHFLSIAAFPKPVFHEFVISQIREGPNIAEQATIVLRNLHIWLSQRSRFGIEKEAKSMVETLLSLGADTCSKATLMPGPQGVWETGFVPNVSTFGNFMKTALACNDIDSESMRKCLELFLAQNPALDHRLSLTLGFNRNSEGLCPVILESDPFFDFAEISFVDYYVVEVNISFMILVMLERIGASALDMSPQLDFERVEPSARVVFFCGSKHVPKLEAGFLNYLVMDQQVSDLILLAFRPWLSSRNLLTFIPPTEWPSKLRLLGDTLMQIADSGSGRLEEYTGDVLGYLAKVDCEYVKAY